MQMLRAPSRWRYDTANWYLKKAYEWENWKRTWEIHRDAHTRASLLEGLFRAVVLCERGIRSISEWLIKEAN